MSPEVELTNKRKFWCRLKHVHSLEKIWPLIYSLRVDVRPIMTSFSEILAACIFWYKWGVVNRRSSVKNGF